MSEEMKMNNALKLSGLTLWQNYCDKKMECERLTEENRRLTELAAQKSSRADELFNMLERLVSPENCRKDVIHLMSEAESLLDKIKQESNDE